MSEIRHEVIQKDSMRFRRNLERTSEIFAYEISKNLEYETQDIQTPLGISQINVLKEQPVIASILRAGLPMHQGLLNVFDKADNGFISAYRKYEKDGQFNIKLEYAACPKLTNRTLIVTDPMLATGSSFELAVKELKKYGKPKHIHLVILIASKEGISYLKKKLNFSNITLWVGAIDDELTAKSYIVPGLGDAGDLAFGTKK